MSPADVVRAWFDAFDASDMVRARRVIRPEATVHIESTGEIMRGFDELLEWYSGRRTDDSFGYELDALHEQVDYAVAFLTLRSNNARWMQTAVYRVEGDQIVTMWLFEDRCEG